MSFKIMGQKESLQAAGGDKVLVFAPHNDDEILATGGIIQQHLKSGASVRIALMTNGDGQVRRPPIPPFSRQNFIKLGYKRQIETLNALTYLGLDKNAVDFFGYPDRGLAWMWTVNWSLSNLYYSKHTDSNHSPYINSYTKKTPYCGQAMVKDIKKLLLEVKPNLVYLPHPNDLHPDHWATNGFVLYGLEQLKNEGYNEFANTRLLCYLVHSLKYPRPRGKFLKAKLSAPSHLEEIDTEWIEAPLHKEQTRRKLRAISKHRTQTRIMRQYLVSFARANELFGMVPGFSLENSAEYEAVPDISRDALEQEQADEPVLSFIDPERKKSLVRLKKYPDVRSVKLSKKSGRIKLSVSFFNNFQQRCELQINIKPFRANLAGVGNSHDYKFLGGKLYHNETEIRRVSKYISETSRRCFRLSIPLVEIGNPCKLILSITLARKGVPFARVENRLVKI